MPDAFIDILTHGHIVCLTHGNAQERTAAIELGENEVQYHKELGEYIYKKNSKAKVITIGNLSKNVAEPNFATVEEAVEYIKNNISKNTKLFLKASRSMRFEKIIELLK